MLYLKLTQLDGPFLSKKNIGLGNILFQLSFQYSIHKKYNIEPNYYYLFKFIKKLCNKYNLCNYDKTIFRNFNLTNNFKENINYHLYEKNTSKLYDTALIKNILKYKNSNILIKNSYLESFIYFNKFKQDIQNIFSPDKKTLIYIYNKYKILKNKKVINISIHLRLNYEIVGGVQYNDKYYKDAIIFIKNKYNNTPLNFFIFSDNIKKAKEILSNINENFIYCINQDYIDLWIMSLCNHNIICHSTFGWWGAYLNKNKNKYVLYPSDITFIYRTNNKEIKKLMKKNHIPKEWICIKSNSITYDINHANKRNNFKFNKESFNTTYI